MEALYDIHGDRNEFLPWELALKMADLTGRINREIAVYLNRKGQIIEISVGDSGTVSLPGVEGRRGELRLTGIRCIHTHPDGEANLSSVDISSLLNLRLDAMAAIGVKDGHITGIFAAIPVRDERGEFSRAEIYGPFRFEDHRMNSLVGIISDLERDAIQTTHTNELDVERAILVGLETSQGKMVNGRSEGERLLDELEELAVTAGAVVVQKILQRRNVKDAAFCIGRGKVEELNLVRQALNADVVIFDEELTGAQVRNLEEIVGIKVIDRTTLILDIFAQRAHSREGKLQVELAQLKYRLPRLIGLGGQLSRLGGGIGTRGPGEKKLEVDRRHIRRKISALETELADLERRRGLMREGRKKNDMPVIALVGYTNVGKSTLMNRLCGSDIFAEDKLFATLDPTTRKMALPDGRELLLSDTVGFIRKLPHDLIEAFKSTLEEAVYADVLLHVTDISSEEAEIQIKVVNEILLGLGVSGKPVILVLNKADRAHGDFRIPAAGDYEKTVEISALTGQGIDHLLRSMSEILPADKIQVEILAPYSEGWLLSYLHDNGTVTKMEYTEKGTLLKGTLNISKIEKVRDFMVINDNNMKS